MLKRLTVTVFISLSVLIGAGSATEAVEEHTGDWSDVHADLKARLHVKHRTIMGKHSEILVYLELCNTCPPESSIKVKFPFSSVRNLSFTVKDSDGKVIDLPEKPIFCSTFYDPKPFVLTLPQDGTMRFCISQNGGGVSQDEALLYLVPGHAWYFKHGEGKAYALSATLSVPPSEPVEAGYWTGKLHLPPVQIPIPPAGQEDASGDTGRKD